MSASDAHDAMAKTLDDALEVHGDHRLVLDDEHVGRHLRGDLAAGLIDQLLDLGLVEVEDARDLRDAKSLPPSRAERPAAAAA